MFGFLKRRRRDRLREQPLPVGWLEMIEKNIPYFRCLSAEDQQKLQRDVMVFVTEKNFEGCSGLVMTDEIKVTIAANACIPLLHIRHDYYPRLKSILVYPEAYATETHRPGPGGLTIQGPEVRLGESWSHGAVVLSWDNVRHGATDIGDGHNVVLHEFAHQLDQEDGFANGAPLLPRHCSYTAWARILGEEFKNLSEAAALVHQTVIDHYGATNPAEFFAVITECFFEKPRQLQEKHPELYEELRRYYQQDPAQALADYLERTGDQEKHWE